MGDTITVTFGQPVVVTSAVNPATEFVLPVKGNSFGAGATLAAGMTNTEVVITLGSLPNLRISGSFSVASVGSGDPTGIDVPAVATGHIKTSTGATPKAGAVDLGGAYTEQWQAGPTLNQPRGLHTATLLDDGRILVVGGLVYFPAGNGVPAGLGYANMSEVYDPMANAFVQTSQLAGGPQGDMFTTATVGGTPMTVEVLRTEHTATLLQDGRVLLVGGYGIESLDTTGNAVQGDLMTAHLFDPKTNTFTQTGSLTTAREQHTATLLPNGTVLVAGGFNGAMGTGTPPSGATLQSAEIFNPATGTFTTTLGTLATPRMDQVAAYDAASNQVLLSGGVVVQTPTGATAPQLFLSGGAECWDVTRSVFVAATSMPAQDLRWQAAAVTSAGIVIAGGNGTAVVTSEVDLYTGGKYSELGALVTSRARAQAAVLGGNVVVVAGGTSLNGMANHELASVEVVNTDSLKVEVAPAMTHARNSFTATALANGKVIAIGGLAGDNGQDPESLGGVPVPVAELYSRP
jgi:hypothetical protein